MRTIARRLLLRSGLCLFVLAAPVPAALAADPIGSWLTDGGAATVRIAPCGAELYGTIIALKEPNDPVTGRPKTDKNNPDTGKQTRPLVGTQIVFGMKPSGANKWSGQVYNAEDGKTYSGNLTYSGRDSLQLQGCALGGLVCKSQTWTKAN